MSFENSSSPLISVYLATHNRCDLLKRAVTSVLSQTLTDYELIISDDGSIDGTEAYGRSLESLYSNITYLRNHVPSGACYARNRAIEKAKGYFITGLDDDDEFAPEHLSQLLSEFDEEKFSCIATSVIEVRSDERYYRKAFSGEIDLERLLHNNYLGNQVFTLTNRLKAVGGFDENFPAFQDYDTWTRLVEKFGPAWKTDNRSYLWHTEHELNQISAISEKRLEGLLLYIQKHSDKLTMSHRDSFKLLEKKLRQDPISLTEVIHLLNRYNAGVASALYLNRNLPNIKKALDFVRFKCSGYFQRSK